MCLDFLYDRVMENIQEMIAAWIREARQEAGFSQEELGAKLALELGGERGYTKANISHWETRKHSPNLRQLLAISKVTGKGLPAELAETDSGAQGASGMRVEEARTEYHPVRVATEDDPAFVHIKKVKLKLSAGIMGFHTEPEAYDGATLTVPIDWVLRRGYDPAKLIAIRVRGESMEPTLYADDLVIVNTDDTKMVDGQVYAVNYEGEAVIKRLTRDAGRWWLTSDNADQRKYHRKSCEGSECIIVGRVVKRESERL